MNAAIREMQEGMERHGYIAEHSIATAVYLAKEMRKPLLIEGDAVTYAEQPTGIEFATYLSLSFTDGGFRGTVSPDGRVNRETAITSSLAWIRRESRATALASARAWAAIFQEDFSNEYHQAISSLLPRFRAGSVREEQRASARYHRDRYHRDHDIIEHRKLATS